MIPTGNLILAFKTRLDAMAVEDLNQLEKEFLPKSMGGPNLLLFDAKTTLDVLSRGQEAGLIVLGMDAFWREGNNVRIDSRYAVDLDSLGILSPAKGYDHLRKCIRNNSPELLYELVFEKAE